MFPISIVSHLLLGGIELIGSSNNEGGAIFVTFVKKFSRLSHLLLPEMSATPALCNARTAGRSANSYRTVLIYYPFPIVIMVLSCVGISLAQPLATIIRNDNYHLFYLEILHKEKIFNRNSTYFSDRRSFSRGRWRCHSFVVAFRRANASTRQLRGPTPPRVLKERSL